MAKQKRALCRKCRVVKQPQLDVVREAYELGKGLGISVDASRPAWERKYVREIMRRIVF
jgi:hypothetical protein